MGSNSNMGEIVIVSGLPRSGTSLMMRMLEAGGIEALTDQLRVPDEDNPNGYFEFEDVKSLREDSSWLQKAVGKSVKMVSVLLLELPKTRKYKVIFMRRDLGEIMMSQKAMLERSGKKINENEQDKIAKNYVIHLKEMISWILSAEHMDVLFVNYNDLISDAVDVIQSICRFFDRNLDSAKMASIIDPNLYRNRASII